jgi:hypothetical protein
VPTPFGAIQLLFHKQLIKSQNFIKKINIKIKIKIKKNDGEGRTRRGGEAGVR